MKKVLNVAILWIIGAPLFAQDDWSFYSGDSITDRQFAEVFFSIELPENFDLSVHPYGFMTRYSFVDNDDTMYSKELLSFNTGGFEITMEEDTSLDISVYSLIGGRWDPYPDSAQYAESIDISYYFKDDKWFVISGVGKYSGDLFYVKVFFGRMYISILTFKYPPSKRSLIEPYIGRIAKSFSDDQKHLVLDYKPIPPF